MSLTDIITPVDAICKKYEKYDKSEAAANEKNTATAVRSKAEIRQSKARLLEELPKLQRLALKKVKGLSKEELEARNDSVSALKERIEAIPDGSTTSGAKQTGGWTASTSYTGIKIDSASEGEFDSEYFHQTKESDRFRQEYEIRRMNQASINKAVFEDGEYIMTVGNIQNVWVGVIGSHFFSMYPALQPSHDQGLDVIIEGLDTLKNMAHDMNEEFDRQISLMDEIDDKVDRANAGLKNTNVRLKETVTKLRSSRNFCIDIILLCIVLGIAAYLYKTIQDSEVITVWLALESEVCRVAFVARVADALYLWN
ncbi:syntaxin-71-like isoform X2 [Fagus crenata]